MNFMPNGKEKNKYRFVIVHGWAASPKLFWFPWLKKELKKLGHEVLDPQMPHPVAPRIDEWVPHLAKVVGVPDKSTIFIGHSVGCQTILRFLETQPPKVRVGPAFLVAPFIELEGIEKDVARPWLETPMNIEKIKTHLSKVVAIFSDDDPVVPIHNKEHFSSKFNSRIVELHSLNHFVTNIQFPELLEEIKKEV